MTLGMNEIYGLLFAVILGGAIGLEREINGKPAGLRTNIIICLGAAAFTLVARRLGVQFDAPDAPGRIAGGIVAGVGFLGAGALIHVTFLALAALLGLMPLSKRIRRRRYGRQDSNPRGR